jgi:Mg/Co/Ni transporter MgtE
MEQLGVATRAEVEPATLAGRLLAEITDCDGCVIWPPFTGAWAVRP